MIQQRFRLDHDYLQNKLLYHCHHPRQCHRCSIFVDSTWKIKRP